MACNLVNRWMLVVCGLGLQLAPARAALAFDEPPLAGTAWVAAAEGGTVGRTARTPQFSSHSGPTSAVTGPSLQTCGGLSFPFDPNSAYWLEVDLPPGSRNGLTRTEDAHHLQPVSLGPEPWLAAFSPQAHGNSRKLLNDGALEASPSVAPTPEPTTILAGLLVLLSFSAGALRALRKQRPVKSPRAAAINSKAAQPLPVETRFTVPTQSASLR